jgi:ribosomal protein L11 methyltransferase
VAWLSISMVIPATGADALSDALLELGADSVDVEYGDALARLVVLAPPQTDPARMVNAAAASADISSPTFSARALEDEDWVRRSQAQFAPLRVGKRLWVVPSWETPPAPPAIALRIDPGLAFGTGSHPSTRLVLNYLEREIKGAECVLDYGCGSGILAIAAAKLGAGEVVAVDLDPQALSVTTDNARANGVAVRTARVEALGGARFDIVLANILSGTLIALEPLLAARTRPGGRIALSGILETQSTEVADAYAGDFAAAAVAAEERWALVEGRRK